MHGNNEKNTVDLILEISGTDPKKCMKCGKCSGTCPNANEMDVLPHQFAPALAKGEGIQKLLDSTTIWMCMSCFACAERCPRDVEPAKLIEAVRLCVIRQQGANHIKASEIPAMIDDETPGQAIVSAFRKYSK